MKLPGVVAFILAGIVPATGWGQGWVADISAGGVSHETVAADVGTRSAILGVRYDGSRWLYLSLGAPLDSAGLPWAAAGLGGRFEVERGAFTLGTDLAGHGHGYRAGALQATGAGATLEALPFIGYTLGDAWLELHTGLRGYSGVYGDSTFSRRVLDHGARVGFSTAVGVELTGEGRLVGAREGNFPYLGAEASYGRERASAWATLGRWLSDDIATTVWGAGGAIEVGRGLRLELSFQQEARDPLYWNLPRRLWSLGVSRAFGGGASAAPLTALPVVSEVTNGRVLIRLPLAEAGAAAAPPSVAGDFTKWQPVQMTRSGDSWTASFPLTSGVYRYAFKRGNGSWFVPESVPDRVDDGFGGVSAVLIVP